MRVFLSYPSAWRELAQRLTRALEAEGHAVFLDRDDLPAGEAFHGRISAALAKADAMLFVMAPEALREGSYTRAELAQAERRWPVAAGRVLPLVVAPVPREAVPPYLQAVTWLVPQGDPVAEAVAALGALGGPLKRRRTRQAVGAMLVLALALAAAAGWQRHEAGQARAEAATRQQAAVSAALLVCQEGDVQGAEARAALDALDTLARAAEALPGDAAAAAARAARVARQDCAMVRLRTLLLAPRVGLREAAAPWRAVLSQALMDGGAAAEPARTADLRAHLAWADAMAWREARDPALDPRPLWQAALDAEPGNPWARAMRGWWTLVRPPFDDAALQAALADQRAAEASPRRSADPALRAFAARLSVQGLLAEPRDERVAPAVQALDRWRRGGDPLPADLARAVWGQLYAPATNPAQARRLLEALPPEDHLATFVWAVPRPDAQDLSLRTWRFVHARLLQAAGREAEAQAELTALRDTFLAEGSRGSLPDAVSQALGRP